MNVNESFLIGTTRFNNDTYQENLDWRNKHKHSGCIYPLNKSIACTIPPNILICVLEMNNSQNKIMGIGLIRNSYDMRQSIKVYNSDLNYNRFIYHSNKRISRENIKYKKMLKALETIVFKGARHMKRGQGITCINWERFPKKKTQKILALFFHTLFS
tara:strand:- start:1072 stop:1545 length:474 start_codon:yes stop_codon:yes gene_type:complete